MNPATSDNVVVAGSAPVWASVEAARRAPQFEGSTYSSFKAGVQTLLADGTSLQGRLDTVAVSGEQVRVLERIEDSLVSVELMCQPNGDRGYVGLMNVSHVGPDLRSRATHVVSGRGVMAELRARGSESIELAAGTTVEVLEGQERDGCADVLLSSGEVMRCRSADLRPVDSLLEAAEVFTIAMQFLGVPYLWGGIEGAGIDCSGLVYAAGRIGGYDVPRDAHHQWAATAVDVSWDELKIGDILFFGCEASLSGIDHVGLYAGDGMMLHAPETGRDVLVELVSEKARGRHVAVGRFSK